LQEYKVAGGGKFDYAIIEPKDEETTKKAKDAGLIEQPFGEASDTDEKAAVAQGFMGLVFKYASSRTSSSSCRRTAPTASSSGSRTKIREIRDKGDDLHHKIGVLTGHDEISSPSDNDLVPSQMGKYLLDADDSSRRKLPRSTRSRTWT